MCMKDQMFLGNMSRHITIYLFIQWLLIKIAWVVEGVNSESAKKQNMLIKIYHAVNFLEGADQCWTIMPVAGVLCSPVKPLIFPGICPLASLGENRHGRGGFEKWLNNWNQPGMAQDCNFQDGSYYGHRKDSKTIARSGAIGIYQRGHKGK